jgi:hypothetical protein
VLHVIPVDVGTFQLEKDTEKEGLKDGILYLKDVSSSSTLTLGTKTYRDR